MLNVDGFPRRGRLDCLSPEETALCEVGQKIEAMGAHSLLTDAVVLVDQARDKLADYIDGCDLGKQLVRDYGNRAIERTCGCGKPADATGYCDDCFGG